jgi:predicted Zn-dependent protease
MRLRFALPLLLLAGLAACTEMPTPERPGSALDTAKPASQAVVSATSQSAAIRFVEVARTVEPVAERECRARTSLTNCDFKIVIDDRPNQPANAFQTVDRRGRPLLVFNLAMINTVRSADELAFVMGHEAAHHMLGHLDQKQDQAIAGAVIFSGITALRGGTPEEVEKAQKLGAELGARTYSKEFELQADQLGTIITARAGYDPLKGAQFFHRIRDPGDRFLGTHPPNAARIAIVRKTVAEISG